MDIPTMIQTARARAMAHTLPEALVCAVCDHESGGWKSWAFKPEPAFQVRYVNPQKLSVMENWGRSMSWGLMQIMGQTARELGFKGQYLSELCDPAIGIEFGCRKLAKCVAAHPGDMRSALLAYNGGSNFAYPDLVIPLMEKYK